MSDLQRLLMLQYLQGVRRGIERERRVQRRHSSCRHIDPHRRGIQHDGPTRQRVACPARQSQSLRPAVRAQADDVRRIAERPVSYPGQDPRGHVNDPRVVVGQRTPSTST